MTIIQYSFPHFILIAVRYITILYYCVQTD